MSYPELLSRSCYSLLEGASEPGELIQAASALGISHLGLVDRDSVYGLVQAHQAATALVEQGHPPVSLLCGATLTVSGRPTVALLVESPTGWRNLCRLLTLARSETPKGRARIETHQLAEHAEGLTCILRYGWSPEHASILRDAFDGRLAVALSRTLTPADRPRIAWAGQLSRALSLPVIASNDALFHDPSRRSLADVLTCIRRRTTLRAAGRYLELNAERHLLNEATFRGRYLDFPQAMVTAQQIAERCTFQLDSLRYNYPQEVTSEGHTPMGWLRILTQQGLIRRYPQGVPDQVSAQVEHELTIIDKLNFPSYFLTVHDIVRFARDQGILCQGRGSAANSAVCYALGITSVDPARTSLLFERFISEERGEPPDIDVDFEHERREEVIQYIYARYGRDRAALVNEFICYRSRSAIRDAGKVFGLSLDQVDRLAKAMDRWAAGPSSHSESLVKEAGLDPHAPEIRATLQVSEQLAGLPRHLSIHVGGFVIARDALIDLVPVEPASMDARTVIQWDKYDVEALNFVKVDVLGLGMLTCIRKCFTLIESFWGRALTLTTVPAEDPAVYDMFCRADTIGVFQIESRAQMSMLPRLKPRCFYDLVIEVAIVRPGPIQGGMVHPYLRRRLGEEPVSYVHPALKPILQRTLGVPLFQEQVMAMAVAVGGFTAGQADQLRRAMGAWRKRGNLDVLGRKLVEGMRDRGIPKDYAEAIFSQLQGFGEYGFPESHAASFALLVYVSGWLRCHYLPAFTAALINSQPMGFYSPRALIEDAKRHGVEVRPVCVMRSDYDCTLEPLSAQSPSSDPPRSAALRLGLRLVQGVSAEQAQRIIESRPFTSVADFALRTRLDRSTLQDLAEADALRSLGVDRRRAAWELQGLWTGLPLFAGVQRAEPTPPLPRESPLESLQADYRSVGLSLRAHPIELVREALDAMGVHPLVQISQLNPGQKVRVAGLISSRQRPGTSNGVVFLTFEDESALMNLVVWPRVWARYRRLARYANLLGADAVVQRQGQAVSLLVEHFWQLPAPPSAPRTATPPNDLGPTEEPLHLLPVRARNFH